MYMFVYILYLYMCVCVCVKKGDHFWRIRVKGGSLKKKMRGDRVSPGVYAATGSGFMLNDYTERKKGRRLEISSFTVSGAHGASGPLEKWIRLLQDRGCECGGSFLQ